MISVFSSVTPLVLATRRRPRRRWCIGSRRSRNFGLPRRFSRHVVDKDDLFRRAFGFVGSRTINRVIRLHRPDLVAGDVDFEMLVDPGKFASAKLPVTIACVREDPQPIARLTEPSDRFLRLRHDGEHVVAGKLQPLAVQWSPDCLGDFWQKNRRC